MPASGADGVCAGPRSGHAEPRRAAPPQPTPDEGHLLDAARQPSALAMERTSAPQRKCVYRSCTGAAAASTPGCRRATCNLMPSPASHRRVAWLSFRRKPYTSRSLPRKSSVSRASDNCDRRGSGAHIAAGMAMVASEKAGTLSYTSLAATATGTRADAPRCAAPSGGRRALGSACGSWRGSPRARARTAPRGAAACCRPQRAYDAPPPRATLPLRWRQPRSRRGVLTRPSQRRKSRPSLKHQLVGAEMRSRRSQLLPTPLSVNGMAAAATASAETVHGHKSDTAVIQRRADTVGHLLHAPPNASAGVT